LTAGFRLSFERANRIRQKRQRKIFERCGWGVQVLKSLFGKIVFLRKKNGVPGGI
jgi:hypothetical protein